MDMDGRSNQAAGDRYDSIKRIRLQLQHSPRARWSTMRERCVLCVAQFAAQISLYFSLFSCQFAGKTCYPQQHVVPRQVATSNGSCKRQRFHFGGISGSKLYIVFIFGASSICEKQRVEIKLS